MSMLNERSVTSCDEARPTICANDPVHAGDLLAAAASLRRRALGLIAENDERTRSSPRARAKRGRGLTPQVGRECRGRERLDVCMSHTILEPSPVSSNLRPPVLQVTAPRPRSSCGLRRSAQDVP